MSAALMTVTAQNNPYIVKTKGVKPVVKTAKVTSDGQIKEEETVPTDFMSKNFRYQSMCDWKVGMRFMVIPEKYDMLVNTFCDATTGKEVSSSRLRHKIMVYKGHEDMSNGRVHVNFTCQDDNKNYYYELPNGTFDDYCFGKMGVPTLAYLGDVDKARELLMNQILLTRTEFFREDTEWDGDGYVAVHDDDDFSDTDWMSEFKNQNRTPMQLIKTLADIATSFANGRIPEMRVSEWKDIASRLCWLGVER